MRIAEGRLRNFQFVEQLFRFGALTRVTAQDGVDESRLRPETKLFGQFHRFMHRRVIGNAVEPEHLIKAQLQQRAQHRLFACARRFCGR